MNKYDFIKELLEDKKTTKTQRDKIIALAAKEFDSTSKLEEKIDLLLSKIGYSESQEIKNTESSNDGATRRNTKVTLSEEEITELKDFEPDLEDFFDEEEDQVITNTVKETNLLTIKHSPVSVYNLLQSFKFNNSEYPSFKFLVHGSTSVVDYQERIKNAREDFNKLKNISYSLYKNVESLINVYEKEGLKILKNGEHPFSSNKKIDNSIRDKEIIFYNGKSRFRTIKTAIQNFKRKYRFDLESSEASILEKFVKNMMCFTSHTNTDNSVFSFNEKVSTHNLFSFEQQVITNYAVRAFFVWNPLLGEKIKWITDGILKHSNILGERNFNPQDKKIKISTYIEDVSSPEYNFVHFDLFDKDSLINKTPKEFVKQVVDEFNQKKMYSFCDIEIFFTTMDRKKYSATILPEGTINKIEVLPDRETGLLYRFKFIYNKKNPILNLNSDTEMKKILIIEDTPEVFEHLKSTFNKEDLVECKNIINDIYDIKRNQFKSYIEYDIVFIHHSFQQEGISTEIISDLKEFVNMNDLDYKLITYTGEAQENNLKNNHKVSKIKRESFINNIQQFVNFSKTINEWFFDALLFNNYKERFLESSLTILEFNFNDKTARKCLDLIGYDDVDINEANQHAIIETIKNKLNE